MKNIFTSLFGKPSIENQTKTNLGQIPVYSPKHPAHVEIQEIEELIEHIHFDAKYKIENLKTIFGANESLDEEKEEQKTN